MKKNNYIPYMFAAIILFFLSVVHICFAQQNGQPDIPKEIENKAIDFIESLTQKPPELIYSYIDEELKKEVGKKRFGAIIHEIKNKIGHIEKVSLIDSSYHPDKGKIYSLLFNLKTIKKEFECRIDLKKNKNDILIRGFNFTSPMGADQVFGFTNATVVHYFVLLSFIACIFFQIYCFIYFLRKKNLRLKWLYLVLSLFGFPFGYGINWGTGIFLINLGFKIPAVNVSRATGNPDTWVLLVFFPIGVVFMLRQRYLDYMNEGKEYNRTIK